MAIQTLVCVSREAAQVMEEKLALRGVAWRSYRDVYVGNGRRYWLVYFIPLEEGDRA